MGHALERIMRVAALGSALLAAVVWIQQLHLAAIDHEHALIALEAIGFLAFWVTQPRHQ